MKKIIIIAIALLALTACESKQVEEVKASTNQSYPVEKLFTVDGITVYRFRDKDRYVYFTNRTGDVQYSYQKRVGKATLKKSGAFLKPLTDSSSREAYTLNVLCSNVTITGF